MIVARGERDGAVRQHECDLVLQAHVRHGAVIDHAGAVARQLDLDALDVGRAPGRGGAQRLR